MNVVLAAWHEQENCTWCERTKECVTVDFGDGFIRNAALCWKCLQKAVKVRNRQREATATNRSPATRAAAKSAHHHAINRLVNSAVTSHAHRIGITDGYGRRSPVPGVDSAVLAGGE